MKHSLGFFLWFFLWFLSGAFFFAPKAFSLSCFEKQARNEEQSSSASLSSCFMGQVSPNYAMNQFFTNLYSPFLDEAQRSSMVHLLQVISQELGSQLNTQAVAIYLKDAEKYGLVCNEKGRFFKKKSILKMIREAVLPVRIIVSKIQEADYLNQVTDQIAFAQRSYEQYLLSVQPSNKGLMLLLDGYPKKMTHPWSENEALIEMSNVLRQQLYQENFDEKAPLAYDFSLHSLRHQYLNHNVSTCLDGFYAEHMPASKMSKLVQEAVHLSQKRFSLLDGLADNQINMQTYSWDSGRFFTRNALQGLQELPKLGDFVDLLKLADQSRLICSERGDFCSQQTLENHLASGVLQHYLTDLYLYRRSQGFLLTERYFPLQEGTIRNIADISQLSTFRQILSRWLFLGVRGAKTLNQTLIQELGGKQETISLLWYKLQDLYNFRLRQLAQTPLQAQTQVSSFYPSSCVTALPQAVLVTNGTGAPLDNLAELRTNASYLPSYNPYGELPSGYPPRPQDFQGAQLWDYFVSNNKTVEEYYQYLESEQVPAVGEQTSTYSTTYLVEPSAPPLQSNNLGDFESAHK